jgi:hypothetical protein
MPPWRAPDPAGARLAGGALVGHDDERRSLRVRLLAYAEAAERRHRLAEVVAQPLVGPREAEGRAVDLGVAQQVREQPDPLLAERRRAEDRKPPRHRDVVAGTQLHDGPPAVDGEERMRARRPDLPAEPRGHLVDRLDAVVDERRRLRRRELPAIAEREQPAGTRAVDVLDGPDAPVREHDLRVRREALPHAGAARDDDQVGRLEARRDAVQVGEARRNAGDRLLLLVEALDRLQRADEDLADAAERRADLALGDVEDGALGLVEQLGDVAVGVVALGRDVGGRADEVSQQRPVAHDARVVDDVGGRGDALGELGQVRGAADVGELARGLQRLGERDEVDGLAALRELEHGAEDLAVRAAVEVLGPQQLDDAVERAVVEQHAAEDRLLGLEALRRHPPEIVVDAHRTTPRCGTIRAACARAGGRAPPGRGR